MNTEVLNNFLSNLFVWSYKIVCLIVGYLFAKLGYELLLKGVTGKFKFRGEMKGFKADLVSASPGTFFILMGTIIVAVTIYRGFIVEDIPRRTEQLSSNTTAKEASLESQKKPPLPSKPPKEEVNGALQKKIN